MLRSILVLFLVAACAAMPRSNATTPDRERALADIGHVLDDFHAAAASADETRYFDQLAEDSTFLGTDATERWSKTSFRAYAHPHFAKGKAWSFRSVRRSVSVHETGRMAWFEEELATQNLGPARGSGVLTLRDGRWKIVQYNLAITVPNERFTPTKEAAGAVALRSVTKGDPLADLAWLSGSWRAQKSGGESVEEHWTSVEGGTLLGSGRSIEDGKTVFFEHLRIEAREGKVVYAAQPRGRTATEFERRPAGENQAVFENLEHDWPKRIAYERTKLGLRVRVSGAADQPVEEWTLAPVLVERSVPR